MREIKFRGKGTKGWVYGYLIYAQFTRYDETNFSECNNEKFLDYTKLNNEIISYGYQIVRGGYQSSVWVEKETVGQYTGLHDKNGKEIYEGDIVKSRMFNGDTKISEIIYSEKEGAFVHSSGIFFARYENEIIGNIYENKNLIN